MLTSTKWTGAAFAALLAATPAVAASLAGAPAPFDKGGVKIAVVNFIGGGDWLQAFEAGAKRQSTALGWRSAARRSCAMQVICAGDDGCDPILVGNVMEII